MNKALNTRNANIARHLSNSAAFVGIAVLWRPEAILALLITIGTNPLYLVLFILSLILAFFFIFKVPCGVREKLHKK